MKIYVVQDYDTVVYAGHFLIAATKKVKGNGCIQIWEDGKCVGWLKYSSQKNDWVTI